MPKQIDREPITVKRGKGGTGGDHVPTRAGVQAHIDSIVHQIELHTKQQTDWHIKHARAEQHERGVASHPEYRGMTPLQLHRAIAEFEGNFWVEQNNILRLREEVEVLRRLLKR